MARGDLIGAISSAVQRGNSLQEAMQSLYNAGYEPKDIDEAAREFQVKGGSLNQKENKPEQKKEGFFARLFSKKKTDASSLSQQKSSLPSTGQIVPQKNFQQVSPKIPKRISQIQNVKNPLPKPIVSNYSSNPSSYNESLKKKSRSIFAIVVIILIFIAIVAGIFLFKENILAFINNLIK